MERTRNRWVVIAGLLWLAAAPGVTAAEANRNDEAQFLTNVRQLIYEGRRSGEGYFSPDGKALIFQSERELGNPFSQIYILDFSTGDIHRVSPGIGKTTCAFFRPRSEGVLFASTHLDPEAKAKQKAELDFRASGKERRYSWDYDEQMDIFSAKRDGSQLHQLTDTLGYDAEASYSPDGKRIVFCSLRDAYPTNKLSAENLKRLETDPAYFGEIYIMNADGSGQKRLTHTPGYDGGQFFSPDGKRIIWRRFDEKGTTADVYTMRLDGSDVRRQTDFGAMSWAPYFHPSGRYVIFTANKLGFSNFELFLVDAEGKREPVRVTFTDGFDGLPVFSPDGKQLCWTSGRTPDGKSQLFLSNWNHLAALAALKNAPARIDASSAKTAQSRTGTNTTAHSAVGEPLPSSDKARKHGEGSREKLPPTKFASDVTADDLRAAVSYLASDALEGRLTGCKGARLAVDFIAENLRRAGLKPLGNMGSYFQDFEFTAAVQLVTNQNKLTVFTNATSLAFQAERDFRPLSFTANAEVEGEIVFAGYGLSVPGKGGEGYDSYAGLNVSNKIALVLRYVPEAVEPKRRQELNRYAALRYKAMIAREHGAKAILIVNGPNSPNAGELAGLSFDSSLSGSGIVAASVTGKVADTLFASSGKDLKAVQSALDTENPAAEGGFVIPNVKMIVTASVEHIKKPGQNVVAYLPPAREAEPHEFVVVGAHYDHLGFGESGTLQHNGEEGQIHNGADDNASGCAAVLELAAALATERTQRSATFHRGVIFAFWSGEELGLIGSSYFTEHPPIPLSNIIACVNFEMRSEEHTSELQSLRH